MQIKKLGGLGEVKKHIGLYIITSIAIFSSEGFTNTTVSRTSLLYCKSLCPKENIVSYKH